MLLKATNEALDRVRLSVNAASLRSGIDRTALTKMSQVGKPMTLENMERWADFLRESRNRWRVLAGYDEVIPSPDEATETLRRRGQEVEEPFDVAQWTGAEEISENDRQIINEVVRGLLAERRGIKKPLR